LEFTLQRAEAKGNQAHGAFHFLTPSLFTSTLGASLPGACRAAS
jgi:hypothetical protein